MTDIALSAHRPGLIATLVRRFCDWMAEEVYVEEHSGQAFTARERADLPTHHPIRDDRDGRSGWLLRDRAARRA
jgi:hypothetical protein